MAYPDAFDTGTVRVLSGLFKLKMQTDCAIGGHMEWGECPWGLLVFASNAVGLPTTVLDKDVFFFIF